MLSMPSAGDRNPLPIHWLHSDCVVGVWRGRRMPCLRHVSAEDADTDAPTRPRHRQIVDEPHHRWPTLPIANAVGTRLCIRGRQSVNDARSDRLCRQPARLRHEQPDGKSEGATEWPRRPRPARATSACSCGGQKADSALPSRCRPLHVRKATRAVHRRARTPNAEARRAAGPRAVVSWPQCASRIRPTPRPEPNPLTVGLLMPGEVSTSDGAGGQRRHARRRTDLARIARRQRASLRQLMGGRRTAACGAGVRLLWQPGRLHRRRRRLQQLAGRKPAAIGRHRLTSRRPAMRSSPWPPRPPIGNARRASSRSSSDRFRSDPAAHRDGREECSAAAASGASSTAAPACRRQTADGRSADRTSNSPSRRCRPARRRCGCPTPVPARDSRPCPTRFRRTPA